MDTKREHRTHAEGSPRGESYSPSGRLVLANRSHTNGAKAESRASSLALPRRSGVMVRKHYYAGTERVAARIGGGGLDALDSAIRYEHEIQENADSLLLQSLSQINSRVLRESDPGCVGSSGFTNKEFGLECKGDPCRMKTEIKIINTKISRIVHSMIQDSNHGYEPEVYFYHSDHLGSASWITDSAGEAVQHLQYLPYGEPYINQRLSGYNERFTFTGKERDTETELSYFGARYYDSYLLMGWLSVDPMSDKYPSLSPYNYCAWNPVKLIDPDGRDVWKIDSKGNIVSRSEDKTRDAFYMVNSKGERVEDAYIEFDYGTVTQTKTLSLDGGSYDMYKIKGDDNGTSLFEFLADNSEVEWSHIKTGKEGGNAQNFITTSHSDNEERGGYHLWKNRLKYGYTVREINHSHPSGIPIPSGMPGTDQSGEGDISFAATISRHYNGEGKNLPIFNVYNCNGGYVQYSRSSVVSDYSKTMELYGVTFINGHFYR